MVIRPPDQHDDYDCEMNHSTADEHRNSPSVLGQAAERQREERVCCTEADHHETNTMDSQRTGDKRLEKQNKRYCTLYM